MYMPVMIPGSAVLAAFRPLPCSLAWLSIEVKRITRESGTEGDLMRSHVFILFLATGPVWASTLIVGEGERYETLHMAFEEVSDGDTVLIRAGTYQYDESPVLWQHDDVAIIGEEGARLVCSSQIDNVLWIMTCDRILVSGLHATHTEPSQRNSCTGNVFGLDSCDDVVIRNCDINGCGAIGVYTFNCGSVTLTGNFIHDNTRWAVQYEGCNMLHEEDIPEGLTMEDNTIVNNGGRELEMVYDTGTFTGEFIEVARQNGCTCFVIKDPVTERPVHYYLTPGCGGPWIEIFQDPERFRGRPVCVEWRDVRSNFMLWGEVAEIMELVSIRIPQDF